VQRLHAKLSVLSQQYSQRHWQHRSSATNVTSIPSSLLPLPQARNKTFDVCYEYQPEQGLQLYELVASIPSSSGNYLATALATLQKNT
jgi:hypothetical protein